MYVALLRGINVGRAKPVAMTDLRTAAESAGFEGVRTLLRSGNVLFVGSPEDDATIARTLEKAIESRLSMNVGVVVRTSDELAAVVEANLLPHAAHDGSSLHVMFLATPLTVEERRALEPEPFLPDEVRVAERETTSGTATGCRVRGPPSSSAADQDPRDRSQLEHRHETTRARSIAMTGP